MVDHFRKALPRWLLATLGAALVFGVITACGGAGTRVELIADSYVGDVDGDLLIGVMVAPHPPTGEVKDVVVYMCDSGGVSAWLFGQTDGSSVVLEADGVSVSLALGAGEVTGEVTIGAEAPRGFTAVAAQGDAGLYRAEEQTVDGLYVGGWIILNTLAQEGALTLDGSIVEKPTLDPATGTADTSIGTLSTVRCFRNPITGERICRVIN